MNNIHKIVKKGLCIGCGLCAYSEGIRGTIFSKKSFQYIPKISSENRMDKIAFDICPGKGYEIINQSRSLYGSSKYDLELGHVYGQYVSHSNDKEVLKSASSGGLMSQIAIYLLEKGIVEKVLTTKFIYDSGVRAFSFLAQTKNEIIQSQGSKYCPVDFSDAIREIKTNNFKVAIIGTPCQIAGIRNIQMLDKSFKDKVVLTISNFCGGVKTYNNINLIAKRMGVDPMNLYFFRFRGNGQPGSMLMNENTGKVAEIPYPKYVGLNGISKHLRCHLCVDATGELADLACGDAWLPRFLKDINPWSVVITRNKKTDDLIKNMSEMNMIVIKSISLEEIKTSQHENLTSKKVRQKSRFYLYKILGFSLPTFDGGYYNNKIQVWTEIKVFTKHKMKYLLEKMCLFSIVYKMLKDNK